jgi:hypothetical protein
MRQYCSDRTMDHHVPQYFQSGSATSAYNSADGRISARMSIASAHHVPGYDSLSHLDSVAMRPVPSPKLQHYYHAKPDDLDLETALGGDFESGIVSVTIPVSSLHSRGCKTTTHGTVARQRSKTEHAYTTVVQLHLSPRGKYDTFSAPRSASTSCALLSVPPPHTVRSCGSKSTKSISSISHIESVFSPTSQKLSRSMSSASAYALTPLQHSSTSMKLCATPLSARVHTYVSVPVLDRFSPYSSDDRIYVPPVYQSRIVSTDTVSIGTPRSRIVSTEAVSVVTPRSRRAEMSHDKEQCDIGIGLTISCHHPPTIREAVSARAHADGLLRHDISASPESGSSHSDPYTPFSPSKATALQMRLAKRMSEDRNRVEIMRALKKEDSHAPSHAQNNYSGSMCTGYAHSETTAGTPTGTTQFFWTGGVVPT